MKLFPSIVEEIEGLDVTKISPDRKLLLDQLTNHIQNEKKAGHDIRLNFICTHNSRRSHFSQIWAQTLAAHYKVANTFCYSGGTETTAIFPKVIASLSHVGFRINRLAESANPIYAIKYGNDYSPIIGFSKKYDNDFNPASNFAAIMTCTEADHGCPIVTGADVRFPISFQDPKSSDNTDKQTETYLGCSRLIATELKYVFQQVGI